MECNNICGPEAGVSGHVYIRKYRMAGSLTAKKHRVDDSVCLARPGFGNEGRKSNKALKYAVSSLECTSSTEQIRKELVTARSADWHTHEAS